MLRMGVYDQIKSAFQDMIAPAIHELKGEMRVIDQRLVALDQKLDQKIDGLDARLTLKIDSLRTETLSMKAELLAEIRRLDARVDGVDRELHAAINVRERLAALEARRPS